MQEIYSKLSKEEKRILASYNDRVRESEFKLHSEQESLIQDYSYDRISKPPLKVLKTKIFNTQANTKKTQVPAARQADKRCKTNTPKKAKRRRSISSRRNSSKASFKSCSSSKSSSKNSFSRKNRCYKGSGSAKVFDVTRISNWKYEVNKFIRTVFRHHALCCKLKEEISKIGGSKVLNEYKKFNK